MPRTKLLHQFESEGRTEVGEQKYGKKPMTQWIYGTRFGFLPVATLDNMLTKKSLHLPLASCFLVLFRPFYRARQWIISRNNIPVIFHVLNVRDANVSPKNDRFYV